ncbi:MAG: hypothetical protein V1774_11575 [Candidatus Eisenbacteria bacterium]
MKHPASHLRNCLPALASVAALLPALFSPAQSCECVWGGPFIRVAPPCERTILARVRSHAEVGPRGFPLAMDVEVLETWRGTPPESPLRIWGDDGMLCRPAITEFPVGTAWLLALNGPGSKPGMSPGPSISMCGTFWLRIEDGQACGNIDDPAAMETAQRLALPELHARFAAAVRGDSPAPDRARVTWTGELRAGEIFERAFDSALLFRLEPLGTGWLIAVRERGRDEDLARLTPPLHGPLNPRSIEGWQFRNAANTGPNEAGEQNVNAPGESRTVIFSPEVGRTIDGPNATSQPTPVDIEAVRRFGEGTLEILEYRLTNLDPGEQAGMEWMRFEVELTWRHAGDPGGGLFHPDADRLARLRERGAFLDSLLTPMTVELEEILRSAHGDTLGESHNRLLGDWRRAIATQAADPGFLSFSIEFWQGAKPPAEGPAPTIRCNVLCLDQVSVAAAPPRFSLRDSGRDMRFDWYVATGDPARDRQVEESIRTFCLEDHREQLHGTTD